MVRCRRFLPALFIAFGYATIVPIAILVRMGAAGWRWVLNDTAFGFFMLLVFPFAVAVFSCVVDAELIKRSFMGWSRVTFALLLFFLMIAVLTRGVYLDFVDSNRVRQPYMFRDSSKMMELATLHAEAFQTKEFSKDAAKYRDIAKTGDVALQRAMATVFLISNFVNVSFSITVFCYILLLSLSGRIGAGICNHLVFVLAAMAMWFPARAYADWFINLTDFSWISTYAAAWVLLVLFVVGAFVLALRMNEGSLYHRFVVPTAAISGIVGTIAALKPQWLSKTALALEGYDPIFRTGLALIVIALMYYVSSTVHERE
jgi:hypothetical protein